MLLKMCTTFTVADITVFIDKSNCVTVPHKLSVPDFGAKAIWLSDVLPGVFFLLFFFLALHLYLIETVEYRQESGKREGGRDMQIMARAGYS